jgi:myo-inositol-1(or 4)-monophosphatase
MYPKIIKKILELGKTLPALSGRVNDIGESERWLTETEIEIEIELTKIIETFAGQHSIYGEDLHGTFVDADNVWVIDSISNTINFLHGMPHYSIVVSHLYKGEVEFAAVYDPSSKELFTAEKGKGAFLNGKKIHVSDRKKELFFLIGPYIVPPHAKKLLKVIEVMSQDGNIMRNLGSLGVHYAYVACGRADVAISFNKDTFPEFAGKLLVEEAGGKFTDFAGGKLDIETRGIIASNGLIHAKVKDIIKKIND